MSNITTTPHRPPKPVADVDYSLRERIIEHEAYLHPDHLTIDTVNTSNVRTREDLELLYQARARLDPVRAAREQAQRDAARNSSTNPRNIDLMAEANRLAAQSLAQSEAQQFIDRTYVQTGNIYRPEVHVRGENPYIETTNPSAQAERARTAELARQDREYREYFTQPLASAIATTANALGITANLLPFVNAVAPLGNRPRGP